MQITKYVIYILTKVSSEVIMLKIELLKKLKEVGMTQSELAGKTGIRPSTICDMCNNNSAFLKLENIDKICCALNCRPWDFIIYTYPEERKI